MIDLTTLINTDDLLSDEGEFRYSLIINGLICNITLLWIAQASGWFITIQYNSITIYNHRLVLSYNLLFAYRNVFELGLLVYIDDINNIIDPISKTDLFSGRVKIGILTTNAELQEANNLLI